MKPTTSALLFASVAAADYGYGYAPSSTVSSSSSSKLGYTTIYPGYGKQPVTVTSQYQAIPTYTASSWSEYPWVSTVISDYDGNKVTITKYDDAVTVYHAKSTITHYKTEVAYPAPSSGYGYVPKNSTAAPSMTTKAYYELYEKVHEAKYNQLGSKVLPGYPGSGLWSDEKHQPVVVKLYKDGKWSQYTHVFTYEEPKPSTTTFANPGTYTIPSKDVTVEAPSTAPAEATTTCKAGKSVTYGGIKTTVTQATTITAAYGAYETHGSETKTVIVYKTITVTAPGTYEVARPTTTVYDHDTEITYPTITTYPAGVYHYPKETVTVTVPNQPYTCTFSQTETYPAPTSSPSPAYPVEEEDEPTGTEPYPADPSADFAEPAENYGTPYAGYVKRGGVLERRVVDAAPRKVGRRVILV